MAPIKLTNPIIAPGSLILVTGVNGLIASHIADQLLAAGYRVRGTVRDLARSSWMTPLFESRHGPGHFELIQVANLAEPGGMQAPEKIFTGNFDYRVDLWRAGCTVTAYLSCQRFSRLMLTLMDPKDIYVGVWLATVSIPL